MDPRQLREEVEEGILELIDAEHWERCKRVEAAERASLVEVMESWRKSISLPDPKYSGAPKA